MLIIRFVMVKKIVLMDQMKIHLCAVSKKIDFCLLIERTAAANVGRTRDVAGCRIVETILMKTQKLVVRGIICFIVKVGINA